jgi:hypothetical protein
VLARNPRRRLGNRATAAIISVQRMLVIHLTEEQRKSYDEWLLWSKTRPLVDVRKILRHAPTWKDFDDFMTPLKKDPPLGSDPKTFYTTAVGNYFAKFPNESPVSTWGRATTNIPPPLTSAPAAVAAPAQQAAPPTATTFRTVASGRKHLGHLDPSGNHGLPESNDALITYVRDNWRHFWRSNDHWTLQLGDKQTWQKGGAYELKPWSILVRGPRTGGEWEIFHYGPTGTEKD